MRAAVAEPGPGRPARAGVAEPGLAGPVRVRLGGLGLLGGGARGGSLELVLAAELAEAVADEADDDDDHQAEQDVPDDGQAMADALPGTAEPVPSRRQRS